MEPGLIMEIKVVLARDKISELEASNGKAKIIPFSGRVDSPPV